MWCTFKKSEKVANQRKSCNHFVTKDVNKERRHRLNLINASSQKISQSILFESLSPMDQSRSLKSDLFEECLKLSSNPSQSRPIKGLESGNSICSIPWELYHEHAGFHSDKLLVWVTISVIWRGQFHGIGWNQAGLCGSTHGDPILVAGELDELAQLLLAEGVQGCPKIDHMGVIFKDTNLVDSMLFEEIQVHKCMAIDEKFSLSFNALINSIYSSLFSHSSSLEDPSGLSL